MKILVVGPDDAVRELRTALPDNIDLHTTHQPADTDATYHAVFDTQFDERHELPGGFIYPTTHLLIGNAVKRTLVDSRTRFKKHIAAPVVGMSLLPAFIGAKTKEACAGDDEAAKRLAALALIWQWQITPVSDAVGLVTPRVLAMIINEAAHTLEEGTATREDIDRGMELGTGYPQGPLKWCDRIGLSNVTDVLAALHEATGDDRYRTAPLLLRMRQQRETFY